MPVPTISEQQHDREGLTKGQVLRIVSRYVGVSDDGYLNGFSYSKLEAFYPEFCDLELDPYAYGGTTTRTRFAAVLEALPPEQQARVIRGVVAKCKVGEQFAPEGRTEEMKDELVRLADQLEGNAVPSVVPPDAPDVVARAIADAELLLRSSGATSGVDRMHTALHGYLIALCDVKKILWVPKTRPDP